MEIKTFTLYRSNSLGSPSGTGRVLDGIVFHNGWTVVCWRTDIDTSMNGQSSIGIYPTWEAFSQLHIAARPGYQPVVVYGHDAGLHNALKEKLGSSSMMVEIKEDANGRS